MSDDEDKWDDIEADWDRIKRKSSLIQVVSDRASDLKSQLEIAGAKTEFELKQFAKQFEGQPFTTEIIGQLMTKTLTLFMQKWHEGLRGQNLSGLIEIVLEGQNLTPTEMRGFLGALPDSLLQRILDSGIQARNASGVHALIGIERHLRTRGIRDYTIATEAGRVYVEFVDPKRDAALKFFLDDIFDLTSGQI